MAIKQAFFPFYVLLIMISQTCQGMEVTTLPAAEERKIVNDDAASATEEAKEKSAIEPWPSSFYEEAWTGIRAVRPSGSLEALKKRAGELHKDPVAVAALNPHDRTMYGWALALGFAEKVLFAKPYEKWNSTDLKVLAGFLTKFTTVHAGKFRENEHRTNRKEAEKFTRLLETPADKLSNKEKRFLADRLQKYPTPQEIPQLLEQALKETQREIILAREAEDEKTRKAAIIAVAVKMHYHIVRISPFQDDAIDDAHLRLGRLVMTIILHQHDIERPVYTDRAYYNGKMLACLKAGSEADLLTYTYELIERRTASKEQAATLESNPTADA